MSFTFNKLYLYLYKSQLGGGQLLLDQLGHIQCASPAEGHPRPAVAIVVNHGYPPPFEVYLLPFQADRLPVGAKADSVRHDLQVLHSALFHPPP